MLIDGGKGQLAVAVNVLSELGLYEVEAGRRSSGCWTPMAMSCSSRRKGQRPSSDAPERSPERVFRPGRKNPTGLKPNSNGMHLLARLRDEAHRFAITLIGNDEEENNYQRTRRHRGLGCDTHEGTAEIFRERKTGQSSSIEALSACPKIPAQLAEKIHLHLHGPST